MCHNELDETGSAGHRGLTVMQLSFESRFIRAQVTTGPQATAARKHVPQT